MGMARPGFIEHPKFKRLAHMLRLPEPYVLGLCEFMWRPCYQSGDPRIGDATDVELAAKWPGEPGVFFRAAMDCGGPGRAGLIEECGDNPGTYRVHDLLDNAPDYVKARLRMECKRRSCSEQFRNVPNSSEMFLTPAPAPAPAPVEKKDLLCSEPPQAAASKPEDDSPIILSFETVGTGPREWHLRQRQIDEFAGCYPGLDIVAECRRAQLWASATPSRRKTAKGRKRFLVGWLDRSQNGRGVAAATKPYKRPPGPDACA
jgi:hypothetical protein